MLFGLSNFGKLGKETEAGNNICNKDVSFALHKYFRVLKLKRLR
jgi:hypothetical protein